MENYFCLICLIQGNKCFAYISYVKTQPFVVAISTVFILNYNVFLPKMIQNFQYAHIVGNMLDNIKRNNIIPPSDYYHDIIGDKNVSRDVIE